MFTNARNVIVTNVSSITMKQGFKQKLVEPLTLMLTRQRIETFSTKSFRSLIFNSSYFVRNLPTTTCDVHSLFVRLFSLSLSVADAHFPALIFLTRRKNMTV